MPAEPQPVTLAQIVRRAGDGVDPGGVREEQRADDGIGEPNPRQPAEVEALAERLRRADGCERHPARGEHEGAVPKRGVAPH